MPLYKMVREFEIRENEFEKTTTKKIKRNLAGFFLKIKDLAFKNRSL